MPVGAPVRGCKSIPVAIVERQDSAPGQLTSDPYGSDLYTEATGDPDTLGNLGPLRPLAGVWEGSRGSDDHPVDGGSEHSEFVERYELQPIDIQTNGPQLFYGLRYHTHIVEPGQPATFHDQIGYWLWEPAASLVTFTLAIPRGQVLLAAGPANTDSTEFELTAVLGSDIHGILSNPFLDRAFRTTSYRIRIVTNDDGTWSYEEEGVLEIPGRDVPFHHVDRNTLHRVAAPTPNPLATASAPAAPDTSLGIGSLRSDRGLES